MVGVVQRDDDLGARCLRAVVVGVGVLDRDVELVLGAERDPRAAAAGLARLGHDEVVAKPQLHVGEVTLAVLVDGVTREADRVAEEPMARGRRGRRRSD